MVKFHIKGIKTYVSKGTRYYYDRKTGTRIHAPYGTPEFVLEVQEIQKAAENERPYVKKGTLGALMHAYFASEEFKMLQPRTKKDYQGYANDLADLKDLELATLEPVHIASIRDNIVKKRTKDRAKRVRGFLSILFSYGIPHGHIKTNPASMVPNLKKTKAEKTNIANRCWNDEELHNFLKHTYPEMRTAVALAAYTSMREQDIIRIPWSAIQGDLILYMHEKNIMPVEIPIGKVLKQILQESERKADTIVMGQRGKSYKSEDGFRTNFTKERNRLAELGLIGKDCTFHGLRHTVLTMIAEEGGKETEIMAVSGHKTESQVRRYTQSARRRKGAKKSIDLIDQRNSEKS